MFLREKWFRISGQDGQDHLIRQGFRVYSPKVFDLPRDNQLKRVETQGPIPT